MNNQEMRKKMKKIKDLLYPTYNAIYDKNGVYIGFDKEDLEFKKIKEDKKVEILETFNDTDGYECVKVNIELPLPKYRAIDLISDDFAEHYEFTIKEWVEKAMEWAEQDSFSELYDNLKKAKPTMDTLKYIGDMWVLKFEEIKEEE